jgi:hypothetical protein
MSYRITQGDLEITKNVLRELSKRAFKNLEIEKNHFSYDTECPSYDHYHALIDALCYVEKFSRD